MIFEMPMSQLVMSSVAVKVPLLSTMINKKEPKNEKSYSKKISKMKNITEITIITKD